MHLAPWMTSSSLFLFLFYFILLGGLEFWVLTHTNKYKKWPYSINLLSLSRFSIQITPQKLWTLFSNKVNITIWKCSFKAFTWVVIPLSFNSPETDLEVFLVWSNLPLAVTEINESHHEKDQSVRINGRPLILLISFSLHALAPFALLALY